MKIRQVFFSDIDIILLYDKHISEEELKNSIELKRVYIAEYDGVFLGWMRYNLFWDNTPFMNMIYLLEDHRNKGIGKQMMEYWESDMKGKGYKVVMTSTVAEEYSQHFYHKLGYKTIGGFMPEGETYEVILSKLL